jgi:hypothetical protein
MPIPPHFRRTLAAVGALVIAAAVVLAGSESASAAALVPQQVAGSPDGVANSVVIGSELYLSATGTGTTFHRLYRFDGTTFTEVPGSPDEVRSILPFGSLVFLTAQDPISSVPVLWTYDPASGVFTELPASPANPDHLTAFNTELVFGADAAVGRHLYSWDGTAISDLTPTGTPGSPTDELVYHNSLYFIAVNGVSHLYYYNGGGAVVGATTDPGQIADLSEADDVLYFQGDDDSDPSTPNLLMSLDDTTGIISTVLFAGSALPGGTRVTAFAGADYVGSDTVAGLPLYRFSGSGAPLETVVGVSGGDTGAAVGLGSILYLPVRVFPVTLYAVDGTSGGPVAGSPADAGNLQVLNGTLYFTGTDDLAAPDRLWKLVTAAAPAQPQLAATGLDGAPLAIVGGAALASLLAGLLLVRPRFVRKRRIASQ